MELIKNIREKSRKEWNLIICVWISVLFFCLLNVVALTLYSTAVYLYYLVTTAFVLSCFYCFGFEEQVRRRRWIRITNYSILGYTVYLLGSIYLHYWPFFEIVVLCWDLMVVIWAYMILNRQNTKKGFNRSNLYMVLFLLLIICSYMTITLLLGKQRLSYNLSIYYELPLLIGVMVFALRDLISIWMNIEEVKQLRLEMVGEGVNFPQVLNHVLFNELHEKIDTYFSTTNSFTDAGFNMQVLSQALDVPEKVLSNYLNHYRKINFYQLLGDYRVNRAIEVMKEKPFYTLDAIMREAGFRSRPSFIAHFRRVTGIIPSEFRKKIDKES